MIASRAQLPQLIQCSHYMYWLYELLTYMITCDYLTLIIIAHSTIWLDTVDHLTTKNANDLKFAFQPLQNSGKKLVWNEINLISHRIIQMT